MDIQIEKVSLGGVDYLSAKGARGKVTTVHMSNGEVFVQTSHKGVPQALSDMAKPSKVAKALAEELTAV